MKVGRNVEEIKWYEKVVRESKIEERGSKV